MKLFKSKKAFVPLLLYAGYLLITLVIAGGLTLGGYAIYKKWINPQIDDICADGKCVKPCENGKSVQKVCNREGGCGDDWQMQQERINSANQFQITCTYLNRKWGTEVYFRVADQCLSCFDYYGECEVPGAMFPYLFATKESCEEKNSQDEVDAACLEIKSKEDCSKVKSAICIKNIIDLENFCSSEDGSTGGKCPDLKVMGIIPIPDLWCRLKEALNEMFLPLKISLTVLGGLAAWVLVLFTLNAVNFGVKKKSKNAIRWTVSIIVGGLIGALIWFYWYYGVILLVVALILKIAIR